MNVLNRFLDYVKFDTQSDELTNMTPSTPGQYKFAEYLKEKVEEMGLTEVSLDENGYLFATLPANSSRQLPTVGFIAHLDTSPDMSGRHVKPQIVKAYDGGDICLNAEAGVYLRPSEFPELLHYVGQDLVTTDGTTLLGADDKAGIAEIMGAVEYLMAHPEIEHGKIRIGFNPDEEIGRGAHKFDVERFGCDWAYTMDGGEIGELEYENFNAAVAKITFNGRNVHPGYAKHKMVNSMRVATQFAIMLPRWETPEHTEGYEGFYHLVGMEGTVEKTELTYIIRDFDRDRFERRKKEFEHLTRKINKEFPDCAHLEIKDQYFNMREKVEPVSYIVEIAEQAMKNAGLTPKVVPIRGGTDGAQLSFKGLPCPNIFAGGLNFHGRYEFVPIESLNKAAEVIVEIAKLVAQR
ncbi:MAG: peptidase T [Bacteroides sp.]|nr:peptidase T [Bacteroides sp.]MBD5425045.1 peptidase T [Bacteroides sp.]MDE6223097.1 peptidase T [Muribaculaceae bacterium]MDE6817928.1 peptidase T [Muribaculaceae bacterium]